MTPGVVHQQMQLFQAGGFGDMPVESRARGFFVILLLAVSGQGDDEGLGKMLIQPQFDGAGDFGEGLAVVEIGHRFGYIDEDGKFEINPQFDKAGVFQDGIAPVWINGRQSYVNKTGKFVWQPAA